MSGLMFAQARYYNADNGRFVSEDQVRGFILAPDSQNHYIYCLCDPISLYDLNGKIPMWLAGIFAHIAIEAEMYAYEMEGYDVRTNVFIPGGGIKVTETGIEKRTATGNGLADVVMKQNGTYYVYEIKPDTTYGRSTGKMQLDGYVYAINDIIQNGGMVGKYGQTMAGESAWAGDLVFAGVTVSPFMPDVKIVYYTNGDGVIYYDFIWPEKDPEPVTETEEEPTIEDILEEFNKIDWETVTAEVIISMLAALVVIAGIKSLSALVAMINPATLAAILAIVGLAVLLSIIKDGSVTNQKPCMT